jgi:hypothetical protein
MERKKAKPVTRAKQAKATSRYRLKRIENLCELILEICEGLVEAHERRKEK